MSSNTINEKLSQQRSKLEAKYDVDIETQFIEMAEESLAGVEAIERMSDSQAREGLKKIGAFADGFSSQNLCADGIAGIFILLYRLKILDKESGKADTDLYSSDRNSFHIYQNIAKKIEDCLQRINQLKESYEINKYVDIHEDLEKIEKAFEKTCQLLLNTYKHYKDSNDNKETLLKVSKSVDAALMGILQIINQANMNVESQKKYISEQYTPLSEKIYQGFGRLLNGLWVYKYGLYFTGISMYNVYNVVILPGDIGPTMNTFFRILTAMCIAFASNPIYLNKARRALVDLFGNIFLKICQTFIPFINLFPDMSVVKGFISFLIHIFFIGYTNVIRSLSIMVCKCIGTTYALYEVGGLADVFWQGVYDLSEIFTRYGMNIAEFIQGIFQLFTANIMEMVNISIINMSLVKDSIFGFFSDIMGSARSFFMFDMPTNITNLPKVSDFSELLKDQTNYPLVYTNAAGDMVAYSEEFKTKVMFLMKNVYSTFRNSTLTPQLMGEEIFKISRMPSDLNMTNEERSIAMQAIRFYVINAGKDIVYETLSKQAETSYEKVKDVVETALEKSKMKPIINWGSSLGTIKQSYISTFLFLTIITYIMTMIFQSRPALSTIINLIELFHLPIKENIEEN